VTYLHDAVAAGAVIAAGARVDRVVIDNARAAGVEALLADGRQLRVRASTVVLGAGSLRSPGILRRSGIESPHLGRHLRLHPTTAIFAEFDEPVETWRGPMQTIVCDNFEDIDDGYGAKFEAVPAHPGLAASAIAWRSQQSHAAVMSRLRNAAALIVLTRDRGEGLVSDDGRDDVRYSVDPYDGSHMLTALAGLVRLAFSAGARSVTTLHTDPIEIERRRASDKNLMAFARTLHARGVAPNKLSVYSAHQMGTCRMHRDPAQGVVDEIGRVHGVEGLMVVDASVFPLSSGVNPMLTIMALAHRACASYIRA
jgi:choline dehydrogenase-like flavoprotein